MNATLTQRNIGLSVLILFIILLSGCGLQTMPDWTGVQDQDPSAVKDIRISALTEFVQNPDQPGLMQVKAQVELMNAMDQSINKPGKWRFEFYEYVPRSSDPRGIRLLMWPDMDLSSPEENQKNWKDFLRGYEFYLPLEFFPERKKYILEATYMADQRRYHDIFKIQYSPDVE